MTIEKASAFVYVTPDLLADGIAMREGFTIHLFGTPPAHRFRKVWAEGYWAALDDIRSGRLVLVDGEFRPGPTARPP